MASAAPGPFNSGISGTLLPVPPELNRLMFEVPGTVALLSRAKTETAEVWLLNDRPPAEWSGLSGSLASSPKLTWHVTKPWGELRRGF